MQRRPRRRHVHRANAQRAKIPRIYFIAPGIAIALLLLILLLRPSAQLLSAPEIARVQRLGVLRVGVLKGVPGMSAVENGKGEGLEIAVAHALAQRIFPEGDPQITVELVPVNRFTALSHLKNGDIDVTIAMQRNTGSESYTYSAPYYTDSVVLLCRTSDQHTNITGRRVGMIEASEAAAAWKAYDQEHESGLQANYFASYPDMITALRAGRVDLLAVPGVLAGGLVSEGIAVHDTRLGSVGYVVVSASDQPAFALLADLEIQRMQKDGELLALVAQYGLTQYQGQGEQ